MLYYSSQSTTGGGALVSPPRLPIQGPASAQACRPHPSLRIDSDELSQSQVPNPSLHPSEPVPLHLSPSTFPGFGQRIPVIMTGEEAWAEAHLSEPPLA